MPLVNRLAIDPPTSRGVLSQNGVKYRTLCGRCNNEFLGHRYDPALTAFTNAVSSYITSPINLPNQMTVTVQPQKIMRSILGHLCAQGVDRYLKGSATEPCRDYFLDATLPLPPNMKMYYWLYPHRTQILVRDAVYLDLRIQDPVIMWFTKFFPLAFALIWDHRNSYNLPLSEISVFRSEPIDSQKDVHIQLRPVIHQHWPEAPTDDHIMMYGQEAAYAAERKRADQS